MIHFDPTETSQNGAFAYIMRKFPTKKKNFFSISGPAENLLFNIVDDTSTERYVTDDVSDLNFSIFFNGFKIKITDYGFRSYNAKAFSKSWNLYDFSHGNESILLSKGTFSKCGSSIYCSGEQIQTFKLDSPTVVRALKFSQIGQRSDNVPRMEFKSFEVYGDLIFDAKCSQKRVKTNISFAFSLIMLVI